MSWERLEGRVTMYLAMAIYIHLTADIFYGIGVIILVMLAAGFLTPENWYRLQNRERDEEIRK